MPWIGSLALLSAVVPHPDPVERLAPDFYGAVGFRVSARWSLTPVDATESLLTLRVGGALDPARLTAPDLAALPAWAELAPRLQVIPEPSLVADEFRWRVRLKGAGPVAIPELAYRYYRPGAPAGGRFRVAYAEELPWPAAVAGEPPAVPRVAGRAAGGVPNWAWLAALPGAWLGCALAPRRSRVDLATRAILIELAARSPRDPAGAAAGALRAALALKFGSHAASLAPAEVARRLGEVAIAEALADCDAARFGPRSALDLPGRAADAVRGAAS